VFRHKQTNKHTHTYSCLSFQKIKVKSEIFLIDIFLSQLMKLTIYTHFLSTGCWK